MAKIPFTLEAWLKDKSQKVVDKDGHPVRIICTDADGLYPIIGLLDNKTPLPCGKDGRPPYIGGGGGTLFLVAPEPELTSWQTFISGCLQKYGLLDCGAADRIAKECSAELLELARKELEPEVLERLEAAYKNQDEVVYENGKRDGKAEALRTRATELAENLAKSGMDRDSTPYHLIEFMCNLYTCHNWKEIEETAEAYVTRIEAAAMKDLPRWRKWKNGACGNGRGIPLAIVKRGLNGYELVDALGIQGEQYIMLSDLEKLPKDE